MDLTKLITGIKTFRQLTGWIILIIDSFVWYTRWDIINETVAGRPHDEIDYTRLILPVILLLLGASLILSKKKNENHRH